MTPRTARGQAEMYRAFVRVCPAAKGIDPADVMQGLAAAMSATQRAPSTFVPPPFVQVIIDEIARAEKVSASELVDSEQRRAIKGARRMLARRLRDEGLTLGEIGIVMGGRDHTTILQIYLQDAA